jgi:hypothetical protein
MIPPDVVTVPHGWSGDPEGRQMAIPGSVDKARCDCKGGCMGMPQRPGTQRPYGADAP